MNVTPPRRLVVRTVLLLFFAIAAAVCRTSAQRIVRGVVADSAMHFALPSANAVAFSIDSSFVAGVATDTAGHFKIRLPDRGAHILRITMVGYDTRYINIAKGSRKEDINLDTIALASKFVMLKGASVRGVRPDMEMKEDTTSFNAEEFHVQEGEALEELIKLLPGVEVDGSNITYNGKAIQEFRVNGKDFFKGRKNIALKNLPVDLVKRIKAYEKKSEYTEQTGIEDGNEQTVMDIELKKELNETWITNLDAAAGSQGRFIDKIFANRITDLSRLTVNGNTSNEDARSINKHLGIDFSANNRRDKKEAGRFEMGGNVGVNNNRSHSASWRSAENFVGSGKTSSFSNSESYNKNRASSASGNMRLEWHPDTMTTVTARQQFAVNGSHSYSNSRSARMNANPYDILAGSEPLDMIFSDDFSSEAMPELYAIVVNRDSRDSKNHRTDFSYSINAMAVRRLGTKGRNVSMDANFSTGNARNKAFRISDIHYYNKASRANRTYTNQYTFSPSDNRRFNARVSYNEPIFKGGFVQMSYRFERSHSNADHSLYELDSLDGWHDGSQALGQLPAGKDSLEMALNLFNSNYSSYRDVTHSGNISFRVNTKNFNMSLGTGIRRQSTHLDYRKHDIDTAFTRRLTRFTPSGFVRYRLSRHERFEAHYDGWSSDPAMTNRLAVTDNSDPLNIRLSNGALKPAWNNRVRFDYNKFIVKRQQNYAVNATFNQSSNNISTAVIYDELTGVRTTMPKNINGNWSANGNFTFSTALDKKRAFHLNANTRLGYDNSVSYASTGGKASSEKNVIKTSTIGEVVNLRFHNRTVDARIGGRINYRNSDNRLRPQSNLNTFNYDYSANVRVRLPWKMSIGSNIRMQSRRGYANKNMNTDELIWNAELSQNFFRGSPLIVRFNVYDILRERSNISRTINAQSRVDTQNDASFSYFMLHAILRLNIFNGKISSGFSRGGRGGSAPTRRNRE